MTVQGDENHGGQRSGKSLALFYFRLLAKQLRPDIERYVKERADENVIGLFGVEDKVRLELKAP